MRTPRTSRSALAIAAALALGAMILAPRLSAAADPPPAPAEEDGDDAPAVAEPISDDAARAARLFESGLYGEAAPLLFRVAAGEGRDSDDRRQIAEYHLAIALYRLRFTNASFSVFSSIAERRTHPRFHETLLWLVKLGDELPEPSGVMERIGRYGRDALSRFEGPAQRPLRAELNYWLGRDAYRRHDYEEAARRLEDVDRASPRYLGAHLLAGVSQVLSRRSVPAVRAFRRVIEESRRSRDPAEAARMKELALLSIGRTYYSTSLHLGEVGAPTINERALMAAANTFAEIEPWSPSWQEALFDQAWAYFMLGDYPRALGNLHTVESPFLEDVPYPEANILRAIVHFVLCRYDDATTAAARMLLRYRPVRDGIEVVLTRLSGDGSDPRFLAFLEEVRAGTDRVPSAIRPFVRSALSSRDLDRHRDAVRGLDNEAARLRRTPASFRGSPLGRELSDRLSLARDLAVQAAGALVRARLQRSLADLDRNLEDARKILVDIAYARAEARTQGARAGEEQPPPQIIRSSDGYVVWPFNGEYWRDEVGHYQQIVTSKCPR